MFHSFTNVSGRFCIQIAHFYNTIDEEMIPSQRPMMLEPAKAFERLIKNPKVSRK